MSEKEYVWINVLSWEQVEEQVWHKKYISYTRNHDSLQEAICLIKEKPKPKSHSKFNKWFKQANTSNEKHSWVENTITYTAATP
jgi:DNA polymerase III delta subunit